MSALKGKKKVWQESTKDNSLFLSTAVQLNSESLATIFSAIDKLKGLSDDLPGFYFTCHQANENKESKILIQPFINNLFLRSRKTIDITNPAINQI
jgi:hypothetical protein